VPAKIDNDQVSDAFTVILRILHGLIEALADIRHAIAGDGYRKENVKVF